MALLLSAVSLNTPVSIVDAVETVASPQLADDLMEQPQMETAARDDAVMTCREAASVLREATAAMEDPLQGIGQPPKPYRMVPRCSLATPNTYARTWRVNTNALTKLHMEQHYPEWSQRVNDDRENSCDVLVALDAKNNRFLAGLVMCPEQFLFLCDTNDHVQVSPPLGTCSIG
jgi:hypothetical protein